MCAIVGLPEPGSSPLTRGKPIGSTCQSSSHGLIPAHAGKTDRTGTTREHPRAHPRSRGENCTPGRSFSGSRGSSPLTRGKLGDRKPARGARRLIPAHAGKTAQATADRHVSWAHPRSRGENIDGQRETAEEWGSSPLTRGKRPRGQRQLRRERLIPAHAGKTSSPTSATCWSRAHPRSRGENRYTATYQVTAKGSSPLTRGKPRRLPRDLRGLGLIPAHAGKTCSLLL